MKNAKINVHVDYIENEYFRTGKDIVSFYITTNVGEDEKELSKLFDDKNSIRRRNV